MTANADTLTETIVLELSDVTGVDPLDLPPLYDAVDVDALQQLFDRGNDVEVEFAVAGCDVIVRGRDDVTATPTSGRTPATLGAEGESDAAAPTGFQD
ncbi:MAG TPA: HalOD1 output domain-containing protein [Natronoarchaeum rubrum]|nr:HalOD1 output domain-containing protein [Natronoarchaeum rubrum]